MKTKYCPECKEEKELEAFALSKSRKDGRQRLCRSCSNAQSNVYYYRNREELNKERFRRLKENPVKHAENMQKYEERNKGILSEEDIQLFNSSVARSVAISGGPIKIGTLNLYIQASPERFVFSTKDFGGFKDIAVLDNMGCISYPDGEYKEIQKYLNRIRKWVKY